MFLEITSKQKIKNITINMQIIQWLNFHFQIILYHFVSLISYFPMIQLNRLLKLIRLLQRNWMFALEEQGSVVTPFLLTFPRNVGTTENTLKIDSSRICFNHISWLEGSLFFSSSKIRIFYGNPSGCAAGLTVKIGGRKPLFCGYQWEGLDTGL